MKEQHCTRRWGLGEPRWTRKEAGGLPLQELRGWGVAGNQIGG